MAEEEDAAAFETLRGCVERGDAAGVSGTLAAHPSLDVNRRDVFQSCLIHLAARLGHAQVVGVLLEAGADPLAVDYASLRKTALHWAAQKKHIAVIEVLMKRIELQQAGGDGALSVLCAMPSAGRSWDELLSHQNGFFEGAAGGSAHHSESDQLVVLAITRPQWARENHRHFPAKFRQAVRTLLLISGSSARRRRRESRNSDACEQEDHHRRRHHQEDSLEGWASSFPSLNDDLVEIIASKAAYPLTPWLQDD